MLLEDIWQGVGDLASGTLRSAGDLAGGALRGVGQIAGATNVGQAIERKKQRGEEHQMKMKQMESLLKSQKAQRLLTKARAVALGEGRSIYGTGGRQEYTPLDKVDDLAKLQRARDAFVTVDKKGKETFDMPPETAQVFDAADRFVHQKGQDNRGLFSGPDITPTQPTQMDWARKALKETEPGHSFSPGEPDIGDYFQVPTETVPVENIPKTHEELGLKNKDAEDMFEQLRAFSQKSIDNFNIEQSYLDNQEHYEKLFVAMREGVPDGAGGRRKLTRKEIIQILRSMGQ